MRDSGFVEVRESARYITLFGTRFMGLAQIGN